MRERPILFSDEMVRAILDGRKTQTRRVAKQRHFSEELHARALAVGVPAALLEMPDQPHVRSPFGEPGDLLWVRECFALLWPGERPPAHELDHVIEYRADGDEGRLPGEWPLEYRDSMERPRWRSPTHMPRWASRISLRVTSVRVERLRDISEEDARAEGIVWANCAWRVDGIMARAAVDAFSVLWDRLAKPGSRWADNPWVWVVGFERVETVLIGNARACTARVSDGGEHA